MDCTIACCWWFLCSALVRDCPSSSPRGKFPVVRSLSPQEELELTWAGQTAGHGFIQNGHFLCCSAATRYTLFWKFKSTEESWQTILRIPSSIVHITTYTNTAQYYVFRVYYYTSLQQYYVLLHSLILRITTEPNTTYYYTC